MIPFGCCRREHEIGFYWEQSTWSRAFRWRTSLRCLINKIERDHAANRQMKYGIIPRDVNIRLKGVSPNNNRNTKKKMVINRANQQRKQSVHTSELSLLERRVIARYPELSRKEGHVVLLIVKSRHDFSTGLNYKCP